MSKNKRLLLSTMIAFLTILMFLIIPKKMHCQNVYIDAEGYFCVECADKAKSSSIYYHTYGFTISRCANNPARKQLINGTASDYEIFSIDNSLAEVEVDGIKFNTFRISVAELLSVASPEWSEEVKKALDGTGPAVYLRFDSIMEIFDGSISNDIPILKNFRNDPPNDGRNPAEIMNAEGWANPNGLISHFNRYILIGGKREEIPEDNEKDELISDGLEVSPLTFRAGNFSDEYVLAGEDNGIPSGENLTVKYETSKWHASTKNSV